jgi:beta-glucosidase
LKNNGLLPLKKTIGALAVIGPNADQARSLLGDYSYPATIELLAYQLPQVAEFQVIDDLMKRGPAVPTVLEGIRAAVSPGTRVLYAKGCDNLDADTSDFDEALEAARQADAVVLVLGDRSGLVLNCTAGETRDSADLRLPGVQEELAQAVLSTGKPVVAVLVSGRPYALPWLDERADAVLEAWIPGEEGGGAVADLLFGDANPGGKLPVTFPRQAGQLPVFYNHKPSGMKSHWYGDYVSEKATPLYPFGYGLSYTNFEYSDLSINREQAGAGQSVEVSLKVTNCGDVRGDEVVQLYIRDEYASTPRPVKELKGYVRLTLDPGASKSVTFRLPVDQLAFYDTGLDLVLEPGRILVMVGSSSDDIRLTGEFEIVGQGKIAVKERVFVCPVEIH